MTSRIGFRTRLVVALVVAVAVTALLVGAISVPLARSSLQDALRDDAIIDTRATLTGLIDDSGLPANPTDDQIADSGLVARLEARGADGVWLEVAEQAPFVSSLAMLEAPTPSPKMFAPPSKAGRSAGSSPPSPGRRSWSQVVNDPMTAPPSSSSPRQQPSRR